MTSSKYVVRTFSERRRRVFRLLAASGSTALAVGIAGFAGGLRINTTPSEPLGIWRIAALDREVRVGDIVFVCPPPTAAIKEGMARGYLRSGLCAGGFGPLIKTVVAVGGQRIEMAGRVIIDGRILEHSQLVPRDGHGREMRPFQGGIVPVGAIFLHSSFSGSWDSRYFGPIPAEGVLGLAEEVLTYAP